MKSKNLSLVLPKFTKLKNLALVPPKYWDFFIRHKKQLKKFFKIKRIKTGQNVYTDDIYIFDKKGEMTRLVIKNS